MRSFVPLLLLAGCTSATPAAKWGAENELAGRVAGPPRSCISLLPSETLMPLDEASLAYRSGRTLWVSRLPAPCRGLDRTNTIVIERSGNQVCRGDHVRVIAQPLSVPGPICILGEFIPYHQP